MVLESDWAFILNGDCDYGFGLLLLIRLER